MSNDTQKHFNSEWLPLKQNKRYLARFTFYKIFNGIPNSLQNFKSQKVRGVGSTLPFPLV